MYMWSSTKTWLRSIDSRSRNSGRSWWAMVTISAWRRATCDSSAIVTLSRNRRVTRTLTTDRNQVPAAVRPMASTAVRRRLGSPAWMASAITLSHQARSASGTAASWDSTKAVAMSRGSWR
jgi:hypothetical protein